MQEKRILIVDDDKNLSMITQDVLTDYGYAVTCVQDSEAAFDELKNCTYHLILLDINLPRTTGFEICKELRLVSNIPVIFASARTSENDKITGLDIGGDDYLAKPYSLRELLSRVNALIRRTYGNQGQELIYEIGNKIIINASIRKVVKNGKEVNLSLKEYDVLEFMCANQNQVIKKEELLGQVWGAFSEVEIATVAVHIRWLREKLEDDPSKPEYIKTVWGIGYKLENEGENREAKYD